MNYILKIDFYALKSLVNSHTLGQIIWNYPQIEFRSIVVAPQYLNLSDADDCRRICEHGAKKLGYGSYQHYALSEEMSDSGSDSDWLSRDLSA